MIVKKVKVECIDPQTGLVLKRIITSEGEYLNRKLAVNNGLVNCETSRMAAKKSILASPIQVHHIRYDRKHHRWATEGLLKSKDHANKQGRLFLPFDQRNEESWDGLTWSESESRFQELATLGLPVVPYAIPPKGRLDDWRMRKPDAISILNKSQILAPIFCSKHDVAYFEDLFRYEFGSSKLIGTQCYSVNDANTISNLVTMKTVNLSLAEGEESPMLFGLSHSKMIKSFSNVSGSFTYGCFGMDFLSQRQNFIENLPPDAIKKMLEKNPEDIYKYDRSEGGFNLSDEQTLLNGSASSNTKALLETITLSENLTPYQAIQWSNFVNQQEDFNILNQKILETRPEESKNTAIDFIRNDKIKWRLVWEGKIAVSL